MILIGEKLNSSIPKTLEAMKKKDEKAITGLITAQEENGADYLDINTAICGEAEIETLKWVVTLALENSRCGIMLDSPSPQAIKEVIGLCKGRNVIINSVTLTDRIDELLPVVKDTGAGIVGLPIGAGGIPSTAEQRAENAARLIEKITAFGIAENKIYIDALAETLATESENAVTSLKTIQRISTDFPSVNTTIGLSNISFGLPGRLLINSAFLAMAVANGLSSAILDVTSAGVKNMLYAALAVCGKDEYCMDYISYIRESEK